MKYGWKSLCATAIAFIAVATVANADDSASVAEPTTVQQTLATYHVQDVAPVPEAGEPDMVDALEMDDAAESPEEEEEEEEDDGPVHLLQPFHGIQVGGWMNGGVYKNRFGNNRTFGNNPIPFVQHADSFMPNQMWIYADKPLDLENNCWDWGFHVDAMWGADGPDTQAFGDEGWDNRWDTGKYYGGAIPQLYFEYGQCDWSVKVGHFYTLIGYEVVQAPLNFFYSHAYVMNYGEPFTHTGALLTKKLSDQVSVTGGYVQGWDSGFNNSNDAHEFLGSVSWTSCDERLNVIYAVNLGDWGDGTTLDDNGGAMGNQGSIYDHSIVAIYDYNECWQYVFQSDYAVNYNGPNDTTWYGVNQYLFYTLSDCYKLGARFEWFDDPDGARVGNGKNDYYALTLGLNYTPNSNVIIRPEVRWDWASDNPAYNPNAAGVPQAKNGMYYGLDFIVQF